LDGGVAAEGVAATRILCTPHGVPDLNLGSVCPTTKSTSEQASLISLWVAAGKEGVTQGGKLLWRMVAPNLQISAEMAACNPMRLLVVAGSPPVNSRA
jgi:hypothetical protein